MDTQIAKGGCIIDISGTITPEIMKCFTCARDLKTNNPDKILDFKFTTMFPTQWDLH